MRVLERERSYAMSATPPRRSRPPTEPPSSSSLPLIPILIAVVVIGFIIGAGLSLAGKHGGPKSVVASRTASPNDGLDSSPQPTLRTAEPTLAPTLAPASASPATPRSSVTLAPAKTPVPATAAPQTPEPATPQPERTATPRASIAPKAVAAVPQRRAAPAVATATPAPAATDETDSDFAKLASAVVRQYLGAVARGDTATARAAFGDHPPDGALAETGIVDASTQIKHLETHSAGDNVTVDVDMRTSTGLYFGQYTIHRTETGAALITTHAINKL